MRIGDVIINPYVPKDFNGKPNPMYKSMVIHIGSEYTTTLRYDGETSKYYTRDIRDWEISHTINIKELIRGRKMRIKVNWYGIKEFITEGENLNNGWWYILMDGEYHHIEDKYISMIN